MFSRLLRVFCLDGAGVVQGVGKTSREKQEGGGGVLKHFFKRESSEKEEKKKGGGEVERSRKCPRTEASRTEKHVFSRATSSNESFNDHPRSERVNKANTDSKVYE